MEQECDFDDYNKVIVEDEVDTNETDLDLELTTEVSMASEGEDSEEHTSPTCSFKIVTDNVDMNYKRSYQRMDYQTISRHYINSYAVLDRVDLSQYSDIPPALGEIDCSILLPSSEDNEELQKIFSILVSR